MVQICFIQQTHKKSCYQAGSSGWYEICSWAAQPRSDGGTENPFYNENSRLIFSLAFRTDGLYASTRDKRAARAQASSAGIEEL